MTATSSGQGDAGLLVTADINQFTYEGFSNTSSHSTTTTIDASGTTTTWSDTTSDQTYEYAAATVISGTSAGPGMATPVQFEHSWSTSGGITYPNGQSETWSSGDTYTNPAQSGFILPSGLTVQLTVPGAAPSAALTAANNAQPPAGDLILLDSGTLPSGKTWELWGDDVNWYYKEYNSAGDLVEFRTGAHSESTETALNKARDAAAKAQEEREQAFFQIPPEPPLNATAEPIPYALRNFKGEATFDPNTGTWVLHDESGNFIGNYHPDTGKVHRQYSADEGSPIESLMVDVEDLVELLSGKFGFGPSFPTDQESWDAYFRTHNDPTHPNALPTDEELEMRLAGAGPLAYAMLGQVALELGIQLGGAQILGVAVKAGGKVFLKLSDNRIVKVAGRKGAALLTALRRYVAGRGIKDFSRADEFGIKSYRALRKEIAGDGLQAHHLIEKRFAAILGQNADQMASIALTKTEHQAFTIAWRAAIPYGEGTATATKDQILEAARQIYKDYPEILKALGL